MRCISALLIIYLLVSASAFAGDEPFTGPSNAGFTGLMETPTARVMKENTWRFGISQIHPFRYYYTAISPLKGLEIEGRVTEILGTKVAPGDPRWTGYGNYKDKAIDLKYQLFPEGKYAPALALGIMDPHGTRLFASQYVVLSKQIWPFDFTLGFGNGRFGKRPLPSISEEKGGGTIRIEMLSDPGQWLSDSQFFWGIQFAPSKKYALMLEYSPIKYEIQRDISARKYFHEPVPSKINIGLRYNLWDWAEISLSYQRGEELGFHFSMPFEIGRPLLPIYDHPYKAYKAFKAYPLETQISSALVFSGFGNIGIIINNKTLTIDLENYKYLSNTKALMVALKAIGPLIPEEIENIVIIFKERDIPVFSFHTTRIDLMELLHGRLTTGEFLYLSRFYTKDIHLLESEKGAKSVNKLILSYKPHFRLYLNDPSGFLKGKLGILGWAGYGLWDGAVLVGGIGYFPFTNISTVNEPLSIPVRTDIVRYIEKGFVFDKFLFEQIYRFNPDIFTKLTLGILEIQYAGLDFEIAKPFFGGRLLLGLSGSAVKKRDPDNPLRLKKHPVKDLYSTAFFNTRLNFPDSEVSLDIKYGRFLAGDVGARFTVSKYIKGVRLFAWYSMTDTSVFNDDINRNYHDKGIGVSIPIRLFKGKDSRTVYEQKISPWTRDVAQDIEHFTNLFDFIGRNLKIYLDKDIDL